MGQYNWYAGDFVTGKLFGQVPLIHTQWSNIMDDSGSMTGTAKLWDPGMARLNVPSLLAETKCFLGVAYQDDSGFETFLQAGQVTGQDYDDTNGELTVTATGAFGYWDRRKIIAAAIADGATNTAAAGGLTFAGFSLGTIAKKILQAIGARTNGLPPIVFQADEVQTADDAHTRTYNGWDLTWAGDALRALTQVINGPEIAFRPRFKVSDPRFIEWPMLTGTEAQPLLSNPGGDWVFDSTAPKSPVQSIGVKTDGTQMGDAALARGNGDEAKTLIGVSIGTTLTDLGYPYQEVEVTGHDSVESQATIYGYAQGGRQAGAKRIMTVTPKIHRDADPSVARYQVGDYVQLVVGTNHPVLSAGTIRSRIVQKSGDDTPFVALQLAPVLV